MKRSHSVLLFIGLYLLGILVYSHGLTASYYYDDFLRVFTNPHEAIWQGFVKANYLDKFYRPLETMVMAFVQIEWGRNTLPLHLISMFFHTCTAYLVFHVLKHWKVSTLSSSVAAAFVVVSQLSVAAVLGNDTQSQLTASLFAALTLWLFYRFYEGSEQEQWKYYASIVCFFLSLISKETSMGLVFSISLLISILYRTQKPAGKSWMQIILRLTPYGLAAIIYLILRFNSGAAAPEYGTINYSFHFGFNIFQNIGLLAAQSILPVSSILMAKAIRQREFITLGLIAISMVLVIVAYGIGLKDQKNYSRTVVLLVFLFFSWIPPLFLNHINEPYDYNALPFIGVLLGLSLQGIYRSANTVRICCAIIVGGIFIGNIVGVTQKADAMRVQGERADLLLPQVIAASKQVPTSGTLYLVDPVDTEFKYTTFTLGGFRVIACGDSVIHFYSGRPDVTLEIIQDSQVIAIDPSKSASFFTYDPSTFRMSPYQKHP